MRVSVTVPSRIGSYACMDGRIFFVCVSSYVFESRIFFSCVRDDLRYVYILLPELFRIFCLVRRRRTVSDSDDARGTTTT